MNINTQKNIRLAARIILAVMFFVAIGLLLDKQNKYGKEITYLQSEIHELGKSHEVELKKIHELGFDQGYQAAIWDVFLGTPLYRVQEDEKGLSLWKKQEIDPITRDRLERDLPEAKAKK